jgi:uncharacterized protein YkwD
MHKQRLAQTACWLVLAAQPAVAGAASAAGDCADSGLLPTQANNARVEAASLCLVNVHRARHGIRALRENADLAVSANGHSWDMVFENYFNHVSPTGERLLDRVVLTGYLPRRSTYIVGENIALGALEFGTPSAIVARWMRSPTHKANILDRDFRDSGIGTVAAIPFRYSDGLGGVTYTQEFGVIAR